MSVELEARLREAYAQLPDDHGNRRDVLARSRRTASRLRRRRAAGMCAGAVTAGVAVSAVAVFAPGVATSGDHARLVPAASNSATSRHTTSPPNVVIPPSPSSSQPPLAKEGTDKPLAGLSGRLLPHGDQLGSGLAYRGITSSDYGKSWPTSRADGHANVVPLIGLVGADQSLNGPTKAQINDTYGTVSGVVDMASNDIDDTEPRFTSVTTSITRFRTPAFAQSAIAKAQRKQGGLYWIRPALTRPNISWSGVPDVTGDHGVYDVPAGTAQKLFVAYQVVGSYMVSAQSESAATAEEAVTDTVSNLKTAGLLR